MIERSSGIMIHITSLPGNHGIGDMGRNSYNFIDFLSNAGQRYWQFLPVGPTSMEFGNSPYTSLSAFAGNSLLIDLDQLREAGFLSDSDFAEQPDFSEYFVEFEKVVPYKERLLKIAFNAFQSMGRDPEFDRFCKQEKWLDDYALFMSLREKNDQLPWNEWDPAIAVREEEAMNKSRKGLADQLLFHKFVQFCFYKQWDKMRQYAARKGIVLIGDIPIYVGWDSADVWANQECFRLDRKTLQPTHVAGVPPDYFSNTGQRWGNPLYKWKTGNGCINTPVYSWWKERFNITFKIVDIVRIDHFRGFEAYWEIPAKEKTAVKGRWVKGPGIDFFKKMSADFKDLPIIAEDLGVISPEVKKMRDDLGFPGMKILHFA
ncbi:MAG: 4-alpha-glucanotransferase, partial [Desulfobulbaceae bacterium]|nr:4-alpha-glucanotransferase [Desulfobulbaceae bacterium]